jgi:hypothetical protein
LQVLRFLPIFACFCRCLQVLTGVCRS